MSSLLPPEKPKWRFVEEHKGFALKNLNEGYNGAYHAGSIEDLKNAFEEALKHDVVTKAKYVSIYERLGPWSRET